MSRAPAVIGLILACALVPLAGPAAAATTPRKAAAALVARLRAEARRANALPFAASWVAGRRGRLWLAFADTTRHGLGSARVRVYGWSRRAWRRAATVRGDLSTTNSVTVARLTGSRDPDFAVEGCGAGGTVCLSVISDAGGRWHAVPFEYGYGRSVEVNGLLAGGHLVGTKVIAGRTTFLYERYHAGAFRPAPPPGPQARCSPSRLTSAADPTQVPLLHFDRVACADGWALALGTGNGFDGPVVGVFSHAFSRSWQALTVDEGLALPAAPAMYDLPLSLLARLAGRLGAPLVPQVAAARLIARLEAADRFFWPPQNGMVRAAGADWLIAVVPTGPAADDGTFPVAAVVYRWDGTAWTAQGRVDPVPHGLNVDFYDGWFVSVPASAPGAVAFGIAGSLSHSRRVITNAGGAWHVG